MCIVCNQKSRGVLSSKQWLSARSMMICPSLLVFTSLARLGRPGLTATIFLIL